MIITSTNAFVLSMRERHNDRVTKECLALVLNQQQVIAEADAHIKAQHGEILAFLCGINAEHELRTNSSLLPPTLIAEYTMYEREYWESLGCLSVARVPEARPVIDDDEAFMEDYEHPDGCDCYRCL